MLHYRHGRHKFDRVFHRFPVIPSLTSHLLEATADKRVLNVGCVGARRLKDGSCTINELHRRLGQVCSKLIGLDCDQDGTAFLTQAGFDAVCGDACDPNLPIAKADFDLVVAVHLIEHLPNPGLFLENARRWLAPGGRLLLVTENPFFLNQTFKVLKYGSPMIHEEHSCLFDPITLSRLFSLTGFSLQDLFWIGPDRRRFQSLLLPFRRYWSQEFLAAAAPKEG